MEKPKDNESVGGLTDSDLSEISYPTEYDENEEIDEDPGEFKKGFSKRKLLHQRLQENKETYDPYLLPRPYEDLQRLDEDQILREGMEIDSKQALVLRISEFAVRKGTCFLFKRGQNTLFRVAVDGIALKNGKSHLCINALPKPCFPKERKWQLRLQLGLHKEFVKGNGFGKLHEFVKVQQHRN